MKFNRAHPGLLAALAFSLACPATDETVAENESDELTEALKNASAAGEAQASFDIEPKALRKPHCCIARFDGGGRACGDFTSLPAFASATCTVAAELKGASSSRAHRGHCREFESCPQYVAPDPVDPVDPSDPPPGRQCPTGQRCCEPHPTGGCLLCFPREQTCP
jgi:hypothetical protein